MTTFDNREKAAENKFTHDAELQFKISTYRNRMAGLWAAEKMGMDPQAAKDYATKLVADIITDSSLKTASHKIHADFITHGLDISVEAINTLLHEMEILAKGQILTE